MAPILNKIDIGELKFTRHFLAKIYIKPEKWKNWNRPLLNFV